MRTGILAGAAALALLAIPALGAEYLGGTVLSSEVDGRTILTDAEGITLYTFDRDEEGVTNCYEQCAVNWPPLMAEEGAEPEGDFTLVPRDDGGMMWAYRGAPLYYWRDDLLPGDTTGDGVGGVWQVALE